MRVILNNDVLLICLDTSHNLTERIWATNTCHILQANFVSTCIDEFLCQIHVVFHRMDWRMSHTERCLCNHTCSLSILDGRNDIACVVQTTEDTSDVCTLSLLHLIKKLTQVLWTWTHAECVECTVEHVGLNTCLMERLGKCTHCLIWILSIKEIHLFKTTAVCFNAVEAAHLDNCRSHLHKLVNTWLILASTLPHITEDQTEFYFFCHNAY